MAGWQATSSRQNEPFGRAVNITANRLLAALPAYTLSLIYPHLTYVSLAPGAVVYDVGDEIDRIYFPSDGVASLQTIMKDGRAIDTAIVGRDGALGAMAAHAPCRAAARCVVRSTTSSRATGPAEHISLQHEGRVRLFCPNNDALGNPALVGKKVCRFSLRQDYCPAIKSLCSSAPPRRPFRTIHAAPHGSRRHQPGLPSRT